MNAILRRNLALVLTVLITLAAAIRSTNPANGKTAIPAQRETPTATVSGNSAKANGVGVPRIAFIANHRGTTNIFAMDPDGGNVVQLTNSPDIKLFPTWSPDGRRIAYLSATTIGKPLQLMVMDADGSKVRRLSIGAAIAVSPPAWSPDSRQIAYISVRSRTAASGLYLVDATADHEQKLETSIPIDFSYSPPANSIPLTDAFAPSWSPDGKVLLFYGGLKGADKTTLLVTVDGKTVKPFLSDDSLVAMNASWSPDGDAVLFMALQKVGQYTKLSLQIADAAGDVIFEFPPDETVIAQFPVWSPDGQQIVFAGISFATHMARIYVMNTDGSEVRQLTNDNFSLGDGWPTWGMVPAEMVER